MANEKKEVHVAEVVRHGDKFVMPKGMSLDDGIQFLQRQKKYEEEAVSIVEDIDAFPWDGAFALQKALKEKFGWATAEPTPGFFGPNPPQLISIEVGHKQTANVLWGRFSMPNVDGHLECQVSERNGRLIFRIGGIVRRKSEELVKEIAELTRKYVVNESIYRGKALRIRFTDDDGDPIQLPQPTFLDLTGVRENELIFPRSTMDAVQDNVFTIIERTGGASRAGVPRKRGVLWEGPYGVGKTLAAYVTAYKAVTHGWTFIYLERAADLPKAIQFAQQYGRTVIFCEDIDRVVNGERTVEMDDLLNIVDGIDTKSSEIMVVLTTNHVEKINQAFLRPGRLDAVISVRAPDADAAIKLVRLYGRGLVAESEDLTEVGRVLAGKIPAVIREVVERSKLSVLGRLENEYDEIIVNSHDLLRSAASMQMQLDLLAERPVDNRTQFEQLGDALGLHLQAAVTRAVNRGVDLGTAVRQLASDLANVQRSMDTLETAEAVRVTGLLTESTVTD